MSEVLVQRRSFSADLQSPRQARRWVSELLGEWGAEASPADLLVTELATNAVLHAASEFEVVAMLNGRLRIGVADTDRVGRPVVRESSWELEGGRGLALVTELSTDWGVTPTDAGKEVWFEL